MAADLRATIGYEQLKKDGMRLFIDSMTDNTNEAAVKVAADMQTLVESAWGQKGQASGAMMLCRLVGYIEGLIGVVTGIQQAGVQFIPVFDGEGKPVSMRVKLYQGEGAKGSETPKAATNLDDLDGPAYEAALSKMTETEREKYLRAAG